MRVAVVILNWNGQKLLEKFLPSVLHHSSQHADVIIADNDSTDDSIAFLQTNYPQIKLIINDKNYGFAEGYNKALNKLDYDYFILLNSDIEVTPDWIEPIVALMDANENIAACQPKIRAYNNKEMFEYAGAAGGFIDNLGYPFCRGRLFQTLEIDNGQYNDTREIFWATGACMFIRAKHFKEAGGFDPDFFAHMEEIDLCWRLKNMGYSIYYEHQSVIYHVGGATLNKMSSQKTFLNFRNNLRLIYKNTTQKNLSTILIKRAFLDAAAAFSFIFSGGFKHFWAVVRAYYAFYKSFSRIREQRKKIVQKDVSCVYKKSIVKGYYLDKIRSFKVLDSKDFI